MVYQDYWALSQWFRHYSNHLGAQHLYVISHGPDQRIADICQGANIITIPRDDLKHFDKVRFRLINAFQAGLSNLYDWVIQSDADELVCFDPSKFGSFEELFSAQSAPALFGLGLNIAEIEGDVPFGNESVFAKRSVACVTGNYSKAWAVNEALPLQWHGVFCGYQKVKKFPFVMPDGVYFCHLKHANLDALEAGNKVRKGVADSVGDDWNVKGWKKPAFHAKRFFRKVANAPDLEWNDAVAKGYAEIRDHPVRDAERGVVKPPFKNYVCRTILPDWFKQY